MRIRKVLATLSLTLTAVMVLGLIISSNVLAQRRDVPQLPKKERVTRIIERIKKGDRKILRVISYSDLDSVVDKIFENAQSNGRNFSQELSDDWQPAVRSRVIQASLAGLFNKDPRVRLTAINWLRRLKPDGSMARVVKQAIAYETVASEVEKRKVKDLDLHDSGFVQDPDALWKPETPVFCPQGGCEKMTYCGRTYWDGGDLTRSNRVEFYASGADQLDHLNASRTADVVKPKGKNGAWDSGETPVFSGRPDHSHSGEIDEEKSIDSDVIQNYAGYYDDSLTFHNQADKLRNQDTKIVKITKYIAETAWLDQGRWNSERSNKVHPSFLNVRKDVNLGILGYHYKKIIRIKGDEEKVDAYDDVWDELNKLDLFITRDVWAKKIKKGEKNALKIISKDTFFSLCRRIDGESNEHIPMFEPKIFGESEIDAIIVGLLENKVVSTRYQCALTLARLYKQPNVTKESKAKIRKALRLARKKALLIDLDKGKEFVDWMDSDLDNRNKKIRHDRRHCVSQSGYREDDEIDTSVLSIEVPVVQDVVDFVYQTKTPIKQYNDYTEISSWDFNPMGTVSLKKDISGLIEGYVPVKEISDKYGVPGEPKWFRPILDERRFVDNAAESKECILFETKSLSGKPYVYSSAIRHLNRFQGYEYVTAGEPFFTIATKVEKIRKEDNIIRVPDIYGITGKAINTVELVSGSLQDESKFHNEIINYLTELKKLVSDWKASYDNYKFYQDSSTAKAKYNLELSVFGNKINETIKRLFMTECLVYELLLKEDKKESFLYDISYENLDPQKQDKVDANAQFYREWIMGRVQERMQKLYPEIRWIQLTRMAMARYQAQRIFDEAKKVAKSDNDYLEARNYFQFSVRDFAGNKVLNLAQISSADYRLPQMPTTFVADLKSSAEYILISNYVNKPVDSVLQQKTGNEYGRWVDSARTLQVAAASVWPEADRGANSLFFDNSGNLKGVDAVCGLDDELDKRRAWIDEIKEKIYQYKYFLDENDKAHRAIVALRSGDRKLLRTVDYLNLKDAFLLVMYQAGIIRYDVDIERLDAINAIYYPTSVRGNAAGITAKNDIAVVRLNNNDSAKGTGVYNDVFGFFRRVLSQSYVSSPAGMKKGRLPYEKGSVLRLAYSNKANVTVKQVPYAANANFFKPVWNEPRFIQLPGNTALFTSAEIAHEDYVSDMYGSGTWDQEVVDKNKFDETWTNSARNLYSKPVTRTDSLYNGVNDDRSNWSARDEMFLSWLLEIDSASLGIGGQARFRYQDDAVKAALGGLLNPDPRVRLACIHLLRRIGPNTEMKGDVELALQDETVEEKRDQYLIGEKKFVNYLDTYGRYQFKNVLKELQKLHAFILRKEMVQKIKKADNEKYLTELSKTLFRILTHQIDRESWWRVPLGIDPEPDARYLYESVAHEKLLTVDNDTSLLNDNAGLKKILTVVAGGIENYYFTNQVETAAWLVRLWDEAMLAKYDNRNKDIAIVLKDSNSFKAKPLDYTKILKFKFWRPTVVSARTANERKNAGDAYFAGRVGRENAATADNADKTALKEYTVYEMTSDVQFADLLIKNRDTLRKAFKKGFERDIIVPFRRARGQEYNFRDVVIVEDGYPDEDRTLRLNNEATWESKQEWFFVKPGVAESDPSQPVKATDNASTYLLKVDQNTPSGNGACFIFGTKYVVASPSAVLAEYKYYDRGRIYEKEVDDSYYSVSVIPTDLVTTIFPPEAKGADEYIESKLAEVSSLKGIGSEGNLYWYKPGVFGVWGEPDLKREDDFEVFVPVKYRDLVYFIDDAEVAKAVIGAADPVDLDVFAYDGDVDGKDFTAIDANSIVAGKIIYDSYRKVWVVSGSDIQSYASNKKLAANARPTVTLYYKLADGKVKKFAAKQARY